MEDGNLKEIHKATGGKWGGQEVNKAFKQFLINIFGNDVLNKFKVDATDDYIGLYRDFEVKKRKVSPHATDYLTFTMPLTLVDIFERESGITLTEAISQNPLAAKITIRKGNKLRLDSSLARSFFDKPVKSLLEHLQIFHDNHKKYNISVALLVGGFSESPMLRCAIQEKYSSWKVLIPDDAGLVVLKGAVLYGHDQSSIVYRVARYTYGVSVVRRFIHGEHPVEKLIVYADGKSMCADIFRKFLEEGSVIKHGQIVHEEKGFTPGRPQNDYVVIRIYASTKKDAQFTTDESCFYLGELKFGDLDLKLPRDERAVDYTITHESTDLHIHAIDHRTGRKLRASEFDIQDK
ncbi:hypothetical protein CHS0354_006675 [Potamilus streckersoni]|uniref:Uncharacterized protein n=1 Tax=Potamilus streckersoni TaxID=2493646 RepID=A0AAE0SWI6_9BIVA|nr:hypothetical protein CHS0354_006675 [Potamilus streckersoni]